MPLNHYSKHQFSWTSYCRPSTEEELEESYEELDKCNKEYKDHEVNIAMGDFNAKV